LSSSLDFGRKLGVSAQLLLGEGGSGGRRCDFGPAGVGKGCGLVG